MSTLRHSLTARDVAILHSLSQVRCLTVEHIQWLHWEPAWRSAARAAQATGQAHYGPKNAYRRLRILAQNGLVQPLVRIAERGVSLFRALPMAYRLTRSGARLLAAEQGEAVTEMETEVPLRQAVLTLEHQLAIGAFYAALRTEVTYRGRQFHAWAADHVLSADYDTVVVPSHPRPLPVLPDATFVLDGRRYLVEVDRGTTSTERWQRKALAHRAYAGSSAARARYGSADLLVLVIAPSPTRIATIARTVASRDPDAPQRYRFLDAARVHPNLIRRKWQQIAAVQQHASDQPTLTWREVALWTPTSEEGG
jgi:hypothetical protein